MVHTDILNRYYVANEHPELVGHFAVPTDDYHYGYVIAELESLRRRVGEAVRACRDVLEPRGRRGGWVGGGGPGGARRLIRRSAARRRAPRAGRCRRCR